MKVNAELSLRQSLVMTADMRLAIDLLSMTTVEVEEFLTEELKKNPVLFESEHYALPFSSDASYDLTSESAYDIALKNAGARFDFREELISQVGVSSFNSLEAVIAHALIHNLDDDGLLKNSDEVYSWIMNECDVFSEWIESVRVRIMDLEPIGCAALDVNETLLHQAKRICLFSHDQFMWLMKKLKDNSDLKITPTMLRELSFDKNLVELKNLNPRPAIPRVASFDVITIRPDILVNRNREMLLVSLLKKPSERVVIKTYYLADKKNRFLKDSEQRANFLLRSLHFREQSLLTVAKAIVNEQQAWFRDNASLRPLTLRNIADITNLSESSVSRLSKEKYLICDRGFFELKYFFSSSVEQDDGREAASAIAIKDCIKTIVLRENKHQPLSDQEIMATLKQRNINISRRTIAKYRDALKIPKASDRKSLIV